MDPQKNPAIHLYDTWKTLFCAYNGISDTSFDPMGLDRRTIPWGPSGGYRVEANVSHFALKYRYSMETSYLLKVWADGSFHLGNSVYNGHQLNTLGKMTFIGSCTNTTGRIVYVEPKFTEWSYLNPRFGGQYADGRPYWNFYRMPRSTTFRLRWERYANNSGWVMRTDEHPAALDNEYELARKAYLRAARAAGDDRAAAWFEKPKPLNIKTVNYIKQHIEIVQPDAPPRMLERT